MRITRVDRERRYSLFFAFQITLLGAAWSDLTRKKVYNRWLLPGMLAGIVVRREAFVLPALLVLIPAFFCFQMGAMGAGDGKLMAVIAGYLGLARGGTAIAVGLAVGGIWSFCKLIKNRSLKPRLVYFFAYFMQMIHTKNKTTYNRGGEENTIPLAFCLVLGVWVLLLWERRIL